MTSEEIKANASRSDAEETILLDREKLAQIGRLIIGSKSIQEFCVEREISRSLVSKLLNGTLNGPPTIRSINKFVGDGNEHLRNDMLKACGYPPLALSLLAKMDNTVTFPKTEPSCTNDKHDWSPAMGLQLVLDKIVDNSSDDKFSVTFLNDGLFSIDSDQTNLKFVCIPAFCSRHERIDSVCKQAYRGFGRALTCWKPVDSFYCILTNSKVVAAELATMPNLGFNLAILLITDRHDFSVHSITTQTGDNSIMDASVLKHLVDLEATSMD